LAYAGNDTTDGERLTCDLYGDRRPWTIIEIDDAFNHHSPLREDQSDLVIDFDELFSGRLGRIESSGKFHRER